jgi:hypothetical protein
MALKSEVKYFQPKNFFIKPDYINASFEDSFLMKENWWILLKSLTHYSGIYKWHKEDNEPLLVSDCSNVEFEAIYI